MAEKRGVGARPDERDHAAGRRIAWFIALALWAFVLGSIVSMDPADPPGHAVAGPAGSAHVSNWMGPVGAQVSYHALSMLGSGVWVLLLSIGIWLGYTAWRGRVSQLALRTIGVVLVALAVSGFHALLGPTLSRFPEGGGGLLAIFAAHELAARFGTLGAALWLALLMIVGISVAFDEILVSMARLAMRRVGGAGVSLGRLGRRRIRIRPNDLDDDERLEVAPHQAALSESAAEAKAIAARQSKARNRADDSGAATNGDDAQENRQKEYGEDELREKIAKLPIRFAGAVTKTASEDDLLEIRERNMNVEADRKYVFPSLDLLEDPEASYSDELSEFVREQAEALEVALRQYGVNGEVAGIDSGPVITLYQVRLSPGTKVSSVTSVSSDIARALKAVNIRIVANTEGLDTVGIEVPNPKKEKVRLKELMTTGDATNRMKLPLFLGKDASGNPLVQDLASMPHLLIAGTTGSGKSVCMNAILMGFLYTQKPSDLKLILVDPKMVELSQFKNIPHLMCPVVTDMGKATAILEWAVAKMDERYELLAAAGCRDITAYNSLTWEELLERFEPQSEAEEASIPRKLPYMVFVIDELADMIITNKEVEGSIVRIAQKARAVGIHLILATQRPQANVVTGLIKSNMPGRIAFKVASGMDSRIVLDQKGGELLLGQGDMLLISPRSATPMRAQGTLVDDKEIRRVTRFIREVSEPSYERQLIQLRADGTPERGTAEHEMRMVQNAQEDPLFDRAVEIVLETKRGSVSLLQRRLAIGYTRASRLIELMGMAGIIGGHKGSVAREVMISLDEWTAMKAQAQRDAQESDAASPSKTARQETDPEWESEERLPAGEIIEAKEAELIVSDDEHAGEQAYLEEDLDEVGEKDEEAAQTPAEDEAAGEPAVEDQEGEDDDEYEYEYVEVDENGKPIVDDEDGEYEYVDEEEDSADDGVDETDEPDNPEIKTAPFSGDKRKLGRAS